MANGGHEGNASGSGSAEGAADFVIGIRSGDRATQKLMGHGHGHGHGYGGGLSSQGILPTHAQPGLDVLGDNEWRHTVLRLEFLLKTRWQSAITVPPPPAGDSDSTLDDIEAIRSKLSNKEELPGRYLEIQAETKSFVGIFENILHYNSHSHPLTADLVATVVTIGWDVAQFYKEKYGRVRPSVIDPTIKPLIRIPGHASYPSGHSTQAHLVADALSHLIRDFDESYDPKFKNVRKFATPLRAAAARVGENREWAGVHYASDTKAGEDLAEDIWDLVASNENFQKLIEEARREWKRTYQTQLSFLSR